MLKKFTSLAVVLGLVAGTIHANAGAVTTATSKEVVVSNFPYEKGDWEIQGLAGGFWDPGIYDGQPKFPYALESLRVGYMVTDPMLGGWCHGNFEVLLEAMGGQFINAPANYLVGGNLILRWNFVQHPNPKWTPYVQIAGGGLYNDSTTANDSQRILGGNVEAMLMAAVGIQYHLSENWALDAEIAYRHISDASTTPHNLGLNVFGGQVGLSYFFR